ncbi:MAG: PIN domain-containing protein [Planctomycetes bacterium]|nr:PIN domain-containing protein [Planctomycetota bacterium]
MILVDTSVWIETLRARNPLSIESVLDFDEIVTCLPVVQEVLQGFRDESAFRVARDSFLALPIVESPITVGLVEEAVGLFRAARRQGLTVRSSVDCLIAACALRHQLTVFHRDRDFPLLARVSPLQQRSL